MLVLRQTINDIVVIPFIGYVYMHLQFRISGLIKGAHCNGNLLLFDLSEDPYMTHCDFPILGMVGAEYLGFPWLARRLKL